MVTEGRIQLSHWDTCYSFWNWERDWYRTVPTLPTTRPHHHSTNRGLADINCIHQSLCKQTFSCMWAFTIERDTIILRLMEKSWLSLNLTYSSTANLSWMWHLCGLCYVSPLRDKLWKSTDAIYSVWCHVAVLKPSSILLTSLVNFHHILSKKSKG